MSASPIISALGGLQQASQRLNEAARNIVETTARDQNAFRSLQEQVLGNPPPQQSPNTTPRQGGTGEERIDNNQNNAVAAQAGGTRYIPSFAEEIVQLKVAASAYKANAKLLSTANEILRTTIESLGRTDPDDQR